MSVYTYIYYSNFAFKSLVALFAPDELWSAFHGAHSTF